MMTPARHHFNGFALATCVLCVMSLFGCHGTVNQRANERFDRTSGMTVLTANAPMVFARTEGRYSISARDYVYLGPIETNRQGTRDYYLWVGVATTLDRGYLAPDGEVPDVIFVDVQGELMEFNLKPWSERAPNLQSMRPYSTAVDVQTQLAARVSLHQLALLSNETLDTLRIGRADGNTRLYRRWQDEQSWNGFLRETVASESVVTDVTRTR